MTLLTPSTPIPPHRPSSLGLGVIEAHESQVRYYSRQFPVIFAQGRGSEIWDEGGRRYIDFFAGAGALNYGHNPPEIKDRLIRYLTEDGIGHSLDMATTAKVRFIKRFNDLILSPRSLRYRLMFPGPTGADAVECAVTLARRATGRTNVVGFTNALHGMSLGSGGDRMPYDGYLGPGVDTLDYFERVLDDSGSGIELPAAVVVETVQADGGLAVASESWLARLQAICRARGILLIADEVQIGCGRTGTFFSFEPAGLDPDIVCLSRALSGYGLPFAVTLVKPEYDCLAPRQHNGVFRGNNLAFVAAHEALSYWQTGELTERVAERAAQLRAGLDDIVAHYSDLQAEIRGRGLIQGLRIPETGLAECIAGTAFAHGLVVETAGADGDVIKLMPALTIEAEDLAQGLEILKGAVAEQLDQRTISRRHV